jgi:hypothetical protein
MACYVHVHDDLMWSIHLFVVFQHFFSLMGYNSKLIVPIKMVGFKSYSFQISPPDDGEWLPSRSGEILPQEETVIRAFTSNLKLEEPHNGSGYCGDGKSALAGNRTLIIQLIANHYGDCHPNS